MEFIQDNQPVAWDENLTGEYLKSHPAIA